MALGSVAGEKILDGRVYVGEIDPLVSDLLF
jgi:hypothetical protein